MKVFRIRNWEDYFENYASRALGSLTWLPVPNKHDGRGYRRVCALPSSVQVFCAWNLIIQVASKTPTRGVLADEDGAFTASDLSAKTGYPSKVFDLAFTALTKPEIGWLEVLEVDWPSWWDTLPRSGLRTTRAERHGRDLAVTSHLKQKGREQNEMEVTHPQRAREIVESIANAPTLALAQSHFADVNRRMKTEPDYEPKGDPFTAAEVQEAWMSLEATKDEHGQWWWGKRPVGDWRAAMHARIASQRKDSCHGNGNNQSAPAKYGSGTRRNAGAIVASGAEVAKAAARRTAKD